MLSISFNWQSNCAQVAILEPPHPGFDPKQIQIDLRCHGRTAPTIQWPRTAEQNLQGQTSQMDNHQCISVYICCSGYSFLLVDGSGFVVLHDGLNGQMASNADDPFPVLLAVLSHNVQVQWHVYIHMHYCLHTFNTPHGRRMEDVGHKRMGMLVRKLKSK